MKLFLDNDPVLHPRSSGRVAPLVRALPLLVAVLLAGCAAPPEKYSPQVIEDATTKGTLDQLYDQMAKDAQDPKLSDSQRQARELRLAEVGRTLAEQAEKEIQAALDSSKLPSGLVPMKVYEAQEDRLAKIKRWDPATFQRISTTVSEGEQKTQDAISEKEAALEKLGDDQADKQLALYDALGALYGPGTDEKKDYDTKRTAALAKLQEQATKAIAAEDYSDAQRMLNIVASAGGQDSALEGKIAEVDVKLFEQRFYDALAKEKPDDAYQALVTLSESSKFDKLRPRLEESGDAMAQYFVTLGADATKSKRYDRAFRYFTQARDIRKRLGLANPDSVPQEKPFLDEMHRRYEKAQGQELYGLAWGYLNVIQELQEPTPKLRGELHDAREEVLQRAQKRLTAQPFNDQHRGGAEYGNTVTAKIVQYLHENLSQDVGIIDREKLDAIIQECKRKSGKEKCSLMAADYIVDGNILEAKVDSTDRSLNERKRVVTGTETVPNPDWDRWNAMSDKERERAGMKTQPPRTIERDRQEDVEIPTVYHRKVGIFSVSYRVLDASSARVLFADTQRNKLEREGVDAPGVDMGKFKQDPQVANLPSDVEILDQLADQISAVIAKKLAEVLANPEKQYQADADRFVTEGDFVQASQQYAYAMVLSDRKNEDTTGLGESLRNAAVSAVFE